MQNNLEVPVLLETIYSKLRSLTGPVRDSLFQAKVSNGAGFTLVEVIVSLVILALAVAGIMASFIASQRFISRSNRRLQAANYARAEFERLNLAVDARDWVDPNEVPGDPLDFTVAGTPRDCGVAMGDFATDFNATCTYEVQTVLNDARRVDLTISWDEPALD